MKMVPVLLVLLASISFCFDWENPMNGDSIQLAMPCCGSTALAFKVYCSDYNVDIATGSLWGGGNPLPDTIQLYAWTDDNGPGTLVDDGIMTCGLWLPGGSWNGYQVYQGFLSCPSGADKLTLPSPGYYWIEIYNQTSLYVFCGGQPVYEQCYAYSGGWSPISDYGYPQCDVFGDFHSIWTALERSSWGGIKSVF